MQKRLEHTNANIKSMKKSNGKLIVPGKKTLAEILDEEKKKAKASKKTTKFISYGKKEAR
jgi:hypothetical protein